MLRFTRLNNLVLGLQKACNEVGNWRVESIGASSDGKFSFHLISDNGDKKAIRIDQFESKE